MKGVRFREVKEFLQSHSTQKVGLGLCSLKDWSSNLWILSQLLTEYTDRDAVFSLLVMEKSWEIGSAYVGSTIHLCPLDLTKI